MTNTTTKKESPGAKLFAVTTTLQIKVITLVRADLAQQARVIAAERPVNFDLDPRSLHEWIPSGIPDRLPHTTNIEVQEL